jgi:hypothetical protein
LAHAPIWVTAAAIAFQLINRRKLSILSIAALALLPFSPAAAFAFALAAETYARWSFFASVTPKSVAGSFFSC